MASVMNDIKVNVIVRWEGQLYRVIEEVTQRFWVLRNIHGEVLAPEAEMEYIGEDTISGDCSDVPAQLLIDDLVRNRKLDIVGRVVGFANACVRCVALDKGHVNIYVWALKQLTRVSDDEARAFCTCTHRLPGDDHTSPDCIFGIYLDKPRSRYFPAVEQKKSRKKKQVASIDEFSSRRSMDVRWDDLHIEITEEPSLRPSHTVSTADFIKEEVQKRMVRPLKSSAPTKREPTEEKKDAEDDDIPPGGIPKRDGEWG